MENNEINWEAFVQVVIAGDTTWFGRMHGAVLHDVLEIRTFLVPTPRGPAEMSAVSILPGYRAGGWILGDSCPRRHWSQMPPEAQAEMKHRYLEALRVEMERGRAEQLAREVGGGERKSGPGLILP